MTVTREEQLDQIGRDWRRSFDEMRRDWHRHALRYGRGLARSIADGGGGFVVAVIAGARAPEAATALAKGFIWSAVAFVPVSVFVAVAFRVASRVRPQSLAIPDPKEKERGRLMNRLLSSWVSHGSVLALFVLLAFVLGRPLSAAFFGGLGIGIAVVGVPGGLLVTDYLYRGLIEPEPRDLK